MIDQIELFSRLVEMDGSMDEWGMGMNGWAGSAKKGQERESGFREEARERLSGYTGAGGRERANEKQEAPYHRGSLSGFKWVHGPPLSQ